MKDIKLYKPKVANEKYGLVYQVDIRGNQTIKDILATQIVVDEKVYSLGDYIGKLADRIEFQQRDYERKVKDLENKLQEVVRVQKEINKNLLNAIREGGTI